MRQITPMPKPRTQAADQRSLPNGAGSPSLMVGTLPYALTYHSRLHPHQPHRLHHRHLHLYQHRLCNLHSQQQQLCPPHWHHHLPTRIGFNVKDAVPIFMTNDTSTVGFVTGTEFFAAMSACRLVHMHPNRGGCMRVLSPSRSCTSRWLCCKPT
jgi:hypothetical protein